MLRPLVEEPKKAAGSSGNKEVNSDDNDPDYTPPKRTREEPDAPTQIYDSDDNEIIEETDKGTSLVCDSS